MRNPEKERNGFVTYDEVPWKQLAQRMVQESWKIVQKGHYSKFARMSVFDGNEYPLTPGLAAIAERLSLQFNRFVVGGFSVCVD